MFVGCVMQSDQAVFIYYFIYLFGIIWKKNVCLQTQQPVFIKLLQGAYRVAMCSWLTGQQKFHVENCIRTLSDIGQLTVGDKIIFMKIWIN